MRFSFLQRELQTWGEWPCSALLKTHTTLQPCRRTQPILLATCSELWTFTEHLSPFLFVTGNCTWCKLLHIQPGLGARSRWMISMCVYCQLQILHREKKLRLITLNAVTIKFCRKKTRITIDQVAHCYFSTYLLRTRLQKYLFSWKYSYRSTRVLCSVAQAAAASFESKRKQGAEGWHFWQVCPTLRKKNLWIPMYYHVTVNKVHENQILLCSPTLNSSEMSNLTGKFWDYWI